MTQYAYDALNRVSSVADSGGFTLFGYDRSGLQTSVRHANGTLTTFAHDGAGRITDQIHALGAVTLVRHRYSHDANGNRLTQRETQSGAEELTTYSYDALDRLLGVVYPDATVTYTYDAVSNRLSERAVEHITDVVAVDRSYSYDTRDRLTAISDQSGPDIAYTYDLNGNQIRREREGVTDTYIYDVRDRMVTVQRGASLMGRYHYNHAGLRTRKTDPDGTALAYVYDGQSVLTQHQADGEVLARYHYGPTRLLGLVHADEGRSHYHHDALGSVAALTGPDGQVRVRYQYDAWGNPRRTVGGAHNPFGFTGHERDEQTGLYYFKARFYDPEVGRFMRADPYRGEIETPPSLHRYLYAYGNPTVYWDPDGHAPIALPLLLLLGGGGGTVAIASPQGQAVLHDMAERAVSNAERAVSNVRRNVRVGIAVLSIQQELVFRSAGPQASLIHEDNGNVGVNGGFQAHTDRGPHHTGNQSPPPVLPTHTGHSRPDVDDGMVLPGREAIEGRTSPYVSPVGEGVDTSVMYSERGGHGVPNRAGPLSAEEANAPHIEKGRSPPYAAGTRARDIVLQNDRVFVRVHGEGNRERSWIMRPHEIEGLTPQQIQDRFALPELPAFVSDVHAPAGTRIRVGTVGEQPGWGAGGATQYELLDHLPPSAFQNRRELQ